MTCYLSSRGKILYHWNNIVTYDMLSVFQIKASIECADTLNSFNDDLVQQQQQQQFYFFLPQRKYT